jgi:hypothetical protein
MRIENLAGRCRSCGVALVDWERIYRRDPADAAFTFSAMRNEFIRHYFWHAEIDDEARSDARKKGMTALLSSVPKRLLQSIGKAQPFRDGTQTPFHGRAVYYAQHATAACCRKCVEEWHGIPRGRELTADEITYLTALVTLFLQERLSDMPADGEPASPRRRSRSTLEQRPSPSLLDTLRSIDEHN